MTYIYLLQMYNIQIYVGHATKMYNMAFYARTKKVNQIDMHAWWGSMIALID